MEAATGSSSGPRGAGLTAEQLVQHNAEAWERYKRPTWEPSAAAEEDCRERRSNTQAADQDRQRGAAGLYAGAIGLLPFAPAGSDQRTGDAGSGVLERLGEGWLVQTRVMRGRRRWLGLRPGEVRVVHEPGPVVAGVRDCAGTVLERVAALTLPQLLGFTTAVLLAVAIAWRRMTLWRAAREAEAAAYARLLEANALALEEQRTRLKRLLGIEAVPEEVQQQVQEELGVAQPEALIADEPQPQGYAVRINPTRQAAAAAAAAQAAAQAQATEVAEREAEWSWVSDPSRWDPDTRREWEHFMRLSKSDQFVGQDKLYDVAARDEHIMPHISIDANGNIR